jgi:hypothetical protein
MAVVALVRGFQISNLIGLRTRLLDLVGYDIRKETHSISGKEQETQE